MVVGIRVSIQSSIQVTACLNRLPHTGLEDTILLVLAICSITVDTASNGSWVMEDLPLFGLQVMRSELFSQIPE